jgi:hypothetical protein
MSERPNFILCAGSPLLPVGPVQYRVQGDTPPFTARRAMQNVTAR